MSNASRLEDDQQATDEPGPEPQRQGKRSRGLTRTVVNFWLDMLLLVVFLVLCWISAILRFVFPAGANATGWQLWGGSVVAWQDLQFGVLCVFAGAIVLHVMLHWSWVCGVINKQICRRSIIAGDGTDTLVGVAVMAAILHLLAIGVLAAWWAIERPPAP